VTNTAESFTEFKKCNSKYKGQRSNHINGRGEKEDNKRFFKGKPSNGKINDGTKNKGKSKVEMKCYLCNCPHLIHDCTKMKTNNAIATKEEPIQQETKMRSLYLPNFVKSMKERTTSKRVTYIDAKIGLYTSQALMDTRAINNFTSFEEAKRLGLKVYGKKVQLKALNLEAKPIHGIAHGIKLLIGEWKEL